MSNIIKATFADGERRATTEALYQWDYGQVLEIEGLELPHNFEVHFGNSGSTTTVTQIGTDGVVTIPDAVLTVGKSVDVFVYLHTGQSDGETEYRIVIPVRARPQPTHETPTPVQQSEIEQALAALETAIVADEDAEAWAVGTRDGVPVSQTDPTYHNNAKWYAEQGGGGGTGLTEDIKEALLQIAQKVVYIDAHGQDYYDDLYDALYPATSYTVTNALTHCTNSNAATSVDSGSSYTATISAESGYVLSSVTVTMGGTDVTSTVYSNGSISIVSVSGNVVITATAIAQATSYTVTNTLTGCTTSNNATTVTENTSYSATISASSGYTLTGATVSVTMGSTDITSSAYNTTTGAISIASVTADVSITVTAVAVTLSSISAVYTQSGTVYNTDSLDSLKTDLVVTATYSDTTTVTVPGTDYTLSTQSGTLTVGTDTVTVTYGGKTDTFTVTVSATPPWKVLSIANDFSANKTLNTIAPNYYAANSSRTAYIQFDILVESGYTYIFDWGSTDYEVGIDSYKTGALEYVANSQDIPTSLRSNSGWQANGYTVTPASDVVCWRFVLSASQSTLINAGVTTFTITRVAV